MDDSMQVFYSRNIAGPNNYANEELVIPVSSTRFPQQKLIVGSGMIKNMMYKNDGKSPYVHADLEKLKQYISNTKPKGHKRSKSQTIKAGQQTLKAVRSVLKAEHLNTDETTEDSFYQMKDYNSNNNSKIYMASKKNIILNKSNKIKKAPTHIKGDKSQHFMSYDLRNSLNKNEIFKHHSFGEASFDASVNKSTKRRIKAKRNSSITKVNNPSNIIILFIKKTRL